MSYRVLIPTAGTGSRLGKLTQFVNKALVTVANRPVISYVIDQFPPDVEFVIALGHKGGLIREFLSLAYPKRPFLFVDVHPFEGPGSGLGLSVLFCRNYLNEPFVFCSCDTLVDEPIPAPDMNWMGYAEFAALPQYRTVRIEGKTVTEICEKCAEGDNLKAYVGMAGINNHEDFWAAMESKNETAITTGEVYGMRGLFKKKVLAVPFTWWDTGNPDALDLTRKHRQRPDTPTILDKPNEAIWFIHDTVIKFSSDDVFIRNRVERASHLEPFCPPITASTRHMYQYPFAGGHIFSEVVTVPLFSRLLDHSASFWERHDLTPDESDAFRRTCMGFYRDKTKQRVQQFYRIFRKQDGTEPINGVPMPTLSDLLDAIDWKWLADGLPGRFHGDFHFENILWSDTDGQFTFLDWRQDFGGSLVTGDIYYDFAKLLHGLIVCHKIIADNRYEIEWKNDSITFDLSRRYILVECERQYETWLVKQGYDVRKVKLLTALIYLNIAALHHHPYCLLLYSLGKQMLKANVEIS